MPFTTNSLDFLVENRLHDDKNWYAEHKPDYNKYVIEPIMEFIDGMRPVFSEIDDEIFLGKKIISRIYRDTRFSKDKTIFREHVWCTFGRPKGEIMPPSFYFDISPSGFEYGCGYYQAGTAAMEAMRSMIISGSKSFKAAKKAVDSQKIFEFYGDSYKKNHFPQYSEELSLWLNFKNIGLCAHSKDFDMLFSDKLADKISDDFRAIAPFYHFLMEVENTLHSEKK